MTEANAGTLEASPHRSLAGPLAGMTCAMVGALALCCAGDYIFFMYPSLNDIWKSVKVDVPWSTRFILTYGVWLWVATAAGGLVSLGLASRRPGRASTLLLNLTMCGCALWLTCLANRGAWSPLINLLSLMQGIDPEK